MMSVPIASDKVFDAVARFSDPSRRRARAAHRSRGHERPAGRERRAPGGRRGPSHVHLPLAVRLPRRRGDREPAAARAAVADPWFAEWRAVEAEHLVEIGDAFAPAPMLTAELAAAELVGLDRLREFGAAAVRRAATRWPGLRRRIRCGSRRSATRSCSRCRCRASSGARSSSAAATASCSSPSGAHRRAVVLPDSLRRREVGAARLVDERLEVEFPRRRVRGARAGGGLMALRDPGAPAPQPALRGRRPGRPRSAAVRRPRCGPGATTAGTTGPTIRSSACPTTRSPARPASAVGPFVAALHRGGTRGGGAPRERGARAHARRQGRRRRVRADPRGAASGVRRRARRPTSRSPDAGCRRADRTAIPEPRPASGARRAPRVQNIDVE